MTRGEAIATVKALYSDVNAEPGSWFVHILEALGLLKFETDGAAFRASLEDGVAVRKVINDVPVADPFQTFNCPFNSRHTHERLGPQYADLILRKLDMAGFEVVRKRP